MKNCINCNTSFDSTIHLTNCPDCDWQWQTESTAPTLPDTIKDTSTPSSDSELNTLKKTINELQQKLDRNMELLGKNPLPSCSTKTTGQVTETTSTSCTTITGAARRLDFSDPLLETLDYIGDGAVCSPTLVCQNIYKRAQGNSYWATKQALKEMPEDPTAYLLNLSIMSPLDATGKRHKVIRSYDV